MYVHYFKLFLVNEVFKLGHFQYFESIAHLLHQQKKIENSFIFVFDDVLEIKDFIELCVLYGSKNIKIVTYDKGQIINKGVEKQYRLNNMIVSIVYDQKDYYIHTLIDIINGRKETLLKMEDVYYIDRYYGKVYIYTQNMCYEQSDFLTQQCETILGDSRFMKIRKGCFVNKIHVKNIKKDKIILRNDTVLYCSRKCRDNMFGSY